MQESCITIQNLRIPGCTIIVERTVGTLSVYSRQERMWNERLGKHGPITTFVMGQSPEIFWEILETDICCVFKRHGLPDCRFSFLLLNYMMTTNMWKGYLVGKFSQKVKSWSITWNDNILGLNLLVFTRRIRSHRYRFLSKKSNWKFRDAFEG